METLDKIQERKNNKTAINNNRERTQKANVQAEYTEPNRQVKRNTEANKQKCVEELATTEEKLVRVVNMKQQCDTVKKLVGIYSKPERPVENKEDKTVIETGEQTNTWLEHFEEQLNRPAPSNLPAGYQSSTHRHSYRCHSTNDRINQDSLQINQDWKSSRI
ncbi:unnamed protein product [Schistosoma mattheei]|uniref:Uncharacterized protein n=1 Tax=Schistosoma mattheei TaxID=31246 RepID=A0A183NR40_9TREM|nr:unnamed protein product [Schistosoma mattheei]